MKIDKTVVWQYQLTLTDPEGNVVGQYNIGGDGIDSFDLNRSCSLQSTILLDIEQDQRKG